MDRRGYAVVFVVVLLLACLGGFLGARFLLQRFQSDLAQRPAWVPDDPTAVAVTAQQTPEQTQAPERAPEETEPRPTLTVLVVATPEDAEPLPTATQESATATVTVASLDFTPLPDATVEITGTIEATGTLTLTVTPAIPSNLPFVLARPVRNSIGDCPGSYVLGQVTDRSGNPLPDIRLMLVDEFGNSATVVSKPGPADKGFYDFPVTGPPRRFMLAVIDADGQYLSDPAAIEHQLGADPEATCHWADWQRR